MHDLTAQVTSSLLPFSGVTIDALGEDEITLDSVLHGKFTVGELPLPEAGDPVPKPGEPPREPGDPVPIPGEMVPGDPENDPADEIPEPGDGVPVELGMEPAPSGAGRVPDRLVSS